MELTEDQIPEKHAKDLGQCGRNMLLPYEYGFTCNSCGYNVIKRKHEFSKISGKKNFINPSKYAKHKVFCVCIEIYEI